MSLSLFRAVLAHAVIAISVASIFTSSASAQSAAPDTRNWATVLDAAKKEGTVFFYSAQAVPVLQRLSDGFRKAYPTIKVEFTRMNSGPMIARLDQERTSGADGADVAMPTDYAWMRSRVKEGQLSRPIGPSMRDWPANFLHEGHFVTGSYEPFVLAYNSKVVSRPPRAYTDLLAAEFKGKLGIPEAPAAVIIAWYDWLDKTQGMDFPSKIMAQDPKVFISSPPLAQAIASGEINASLLNNPSSMRALVDNGAPIAFNVPDPAFAFANYVAAFRWSKRPNAGLVLLDWLMSRDGQAVWCGTGESASPLKGIAGALQVPGSVTFYDPDQWSPEAQKRYVERYNRVYRK